MRAQTRAMPAGSFQSGVREISVKTKGEIKTAEDIENLLIPNPAGTLVRVRDVAVVVDTVADERSASFLDGKPAISLVVRKQSGANNVEMAHRVRGELERLRPRL